MPTSTTLHPALPTFEALGVPAPFVASLADSGITAPFPIQASTIPDALSGRDVLGRGRTGSGKTLAFSLAALTMLHRSGHRRVPGRTRGLVVVPTRELAQQVADVMLPLAKAAGLRVAAVYGGVAYGPQTKAVRHGLDVVIATPGRLEDLIARGEVRLDQVEVTVLDEADHMADLGFLPAVTRLLEATPADGQRLLFSATLDGAVDRLVRRFLHEPAVHQVDPADADVPVMAHHVFRVDGRDKHEVVRQLAAGQGRTVAFTRTKHGAKNLARRLTAAGIPAVDLHGNLSQAVRRKNLDRFSSGRVRVLVATDIAARGIHVDDVALVVHVDPPAEHKAYVHRSGRTARAGNEGIVVTVSTPAEHNGVKAMMKRAGIKPVMRPVTPGHPAIGEVVGPPAPRVEPSAVVSDPVAEVSRPRRPRPRAATPRTSTPRTGSGPGARSGSRNGSPNGSRSGSRGRPAGRTRAAR